MEKAKKQFIVFILLFILCGISFAWINTPELLKEIEQKEAAVKAAPNSPDARFDMAITYAYTNKIEAGLDALKVTGNIAGNTKKYSRYLIEKYYAEVIDNPGNWKARFRLAFAYYFGGYKKQASNELQNVANLDSKNPWPYGYMAVIAAEDERWQEGIKYMKKAISIDSNVAAFHLGLAQAYYKTGNSFGGVMEAGEALRLRTLGY
jgi:predicted Zn-dependent protease